MTVVTESVLGQPEDVNIGEVMTLGDTNFALACIKIGHTIPEGGESSLKRAAVLLEYPDPDERGILWTYLSTMQGIIPLTEGESVDDYSERVRINMAGVVDALTRLADGQEVDPETLAITGFVVGQADSLSMNGFRFKSHQPPTDQY